MKSLSPPLTATAAAIALLLTGATLAQVGTFRHRPQLPPNPAPHHPQPGGGPQFGDPVFGLTAAQQQAFIAGREEFEAVETVEGGLGPIFNGTSCQGCHALAATGGAGTTQVTRFGRLVNGQFDAMEAEGGSLLQSQAIAPAALEHVPATATLVAQRLTTPLFGAGLIEAIADDDILQGARRPRPDGVSGRAALVTDVVSGRTRVGRFGWKAQQATLLAFAGDAYRNEMGVTNRFFPTENAPNGNLALLAQYDSVPDIEDAVDPATGRSDIDAAAAAPPPPSGALLPPPPQVRMTASALSGARVFDQIGCTACHVPSLTTGFSAVPALSHQTVPLYSDLLLHDMGKLGDGIAQAAATGREMRTAPLWGLRARAPYLHDGRAKTVADAIRAHEGEAVPARNRFDALPAQPLQQVLDFLASI